MFCKISKKIMALITNNINQSNQLNSETDETNSELNLTIEELEYLFNLIKKSNFSGAELEVIYRIIIKLQKQYILLKK
jgi:uncharacterized protein YfkK (UPF0435 family)